MTKRALGGLALMAVAVVALYGWRLDTAPTYLNWDEAIFGLQAHSIATTAHDTNGRLLPFYFQMRLFSDNMWFQPALIYHTALFLKVLPLSESAIRWPSVFVGLTDVVLLYFLARRIFGRDRWAFCAAILLVLTPAHFIHSRLALDYIYPLPFVMAWLLSLLIFIERRKLWLLFLSTSFLGLGFFSYIASLVMMPLYLLLTWLTLFTTSTGLKRSWLVATTGFLWPLLLLVPWLLFHTSFVTETVSRYQVGTYPSREAIEPAASMGALLQELRRPVHFSDLTGRISLYWYFFDPAYLFVTGGYANPTNSTRRVGVFLLPLLVFVPVGLARIASLKRTRIDLLLLLGFASAPLAACLVVPEPYAIDREMELLPFGVLIATCGIEYMLSAPQRLWRIASASLLALVPLHFAFFCVDYWKDYPLRTAYVFGGNRRGALEEIIARNPKDHPLAVYLNEDRIPHVNVHWQFYLVKHGRQDLLPHTVYFDSKAVDLRTVPPGSLVMADDAFAMTLVATGQFRQLALFPEPGNPPAFALLQK